VSDKRARDLALEAFVYVPVGLALSARDLVPELARRGRERVTGQVTQARIIGKFAVHQGQAQAGKAFTKARTDAQDRLSDLGTTSPTPSSRAPVTAPAARAATSGPEGGDLAIPGYDSLSASQVLPRLEALAPAELEAVRAYEAAHRGRKTILGRIAQLQ
jgi:hypothetical protein